MNYDNLQNQKVMELTQIALNVLDELNLLYKHDDINNIILRIEAIQEECEKHIEEEPKIYHIDDYRVHF